MMSIFSPRSSRLMTWIRVPRRPPQRDRVDFALVEATATFARSPPPAHVAFTRTMPSWISGISVWKSAPGSRMRARERDLRALGGPPHLQDERRIRSPGYSASPGTARAPAGCLRLADLEDHVALLDAMDDASENLTFFPGELRVDPLARRRPAPSGG